MQCDGGSGSGTAALVTARGRNQQGAVYWPGREIADGWAGGRGGGTTARAGLAGGGAEKQMKRPANHGGLGVSARPKELHRTRATGDLIPPRALSSTHRPPLDACSSCALSLNPGALARCPFRQPAPGLPACGLSSLSRSQMRPLGCAHLA